MFKKYISKNIVFISLFIILAILPVISLLYPGLPVTHDGQDHVARIANFYQNLTEGNLIPRWAANLNWGYGHPILEFLYPLPSYVASFFHLVGFTLVDSVKIVFVLSMVLPLLFMYIWLSTFLSRYAALFGAVLYTYAPYRFVEVYVRGDIGENLAFAFIPLVLFFTYKIYKENEFKYVIFGGISLALLILCHNAISLMSIPFIGMYGLLLFFLIKDKKPYFIKLFSLITLGFCLSMFFWLPALIEGKYTLRNIVTKGGYVDRFVSISSLLYGPWNYGITGQFTVQIGIFQWVGIILSPLILRLVRKDKEKFYLVLILIAFVIVSIFIMNKSSEFIWQNILLLQNFQFPWRFLALAVFASSVLGAFIIEIISKKFSFKVFLLFTTVVIVISSFYWNAREYQQKPESFYSDVYESTTDTGESAPIWSVRFMEKRPTAPIEIVEGKGEVKEVIRKSAYRKFEFKGENSAKILVNILYFPNWTIYVDGKRQITQFQDPNYRGLMTFIVTGRPHTIEAVYKNTKLRTFSDLVSLVSLIVIIGFFLIRFTKFKFHKL
ncbi:MAG: 6-pyruvoyl-tetrahydropterin synthase-related protein [Patescibacteria group bacterium]